MAHCQSAEWFPLLRSSNLVRSRLPTSDEISQPLLAPAADAPLAPELALWGPPHSPGGAAGIRTPDLRRARAALSRLSYGPCTRSPPPPPPRVGAPGLEPGTSALSGPRSNHLSYAPAGAPGHPGRHGLRSPLRRGPRRHDLTSSGPHTRPLPKTERADGPAHKLAANRRT